MWRDIVDPLEVLEELEEGTLRVRELLTVRATWTGRWPRGRIHASRAACEPCPTELASVLVKRCEPLALPA